MTATNTIRVSSDVLQALRNRRTAKALTYDAVIHDLLAEVEESRERRADRGSRA